jgi:hypothetical protein
MVVLMLNSVGRFIHLETRDGSVREGKLTGFTLRSFKLNGEDVDWPTHLELNGDPHDLIKLEMVAKLSID